MTNIQTTRNAHAQVNWPDRMQFCVALLLVAIGALGRWGEPTWCFTPIGACAVAAGFFLGSWKLAVLVPMVTLAVGDLGLPGYGSSAIVLATYLCMTFPVLVGRLLRRRYENADHDGRWTLLGPTLAAGVVPATLFFVVTNFAVWSFQSLYPKTLWGLVDCYIAAIPFYRSMLAGDLFYLGCLAACGYIATAWSTSRGLDSPRAATRPGRAAKQSRDQTWSRG